MGFVLGWSRTLIKKEEFGAWSATKLEIGDIVEWTTWNTETSNWDSNYGILVNVGNRIRSDRIVSISKVMPINDPHIELEFFTMNLKLVKEQEDVRWNPQQIT